MNMNKIIIVNCRTDFMKFNFSTCNFFIVLYECIISLWPCYMTCNIIFTSIYLKVVNNCNDIVIES